MDHLAPTAKAFVEHLVDAEQRCSPLWMRQTLRCLKGVDEPTLRATYGAIVLDPDLPALNEAFQAFMRAQTTDTLG